MEEKVIMVRKVRNYSLELMFVACLISLLFRDKYITAGIVVGTLVGLIGFNMIVSMAYRIEGASGQRHAMMNYLLRYIFYGCIFGLSMWVGINIFACLIGFVCHKVSILIYSKWGTRR